MRNLHFETALFSKQVTLTHRAHCVAATLNQRHWRWFNVATSPCSRWGPTVCDALPTSKEHRISVSCPPGRIIAQEKEDLYWAHATLLPCKPKMLYLLPAQVMSSCILILRSSIIWLIYMWLIYAHTPGRIITSLQGTNSIPPYSITAYPKLITNTHLNGESWTWKTADLGTQLVAHLTFRHVGHLFEIHVPTEWMDSVGLPGSQLYLNPYNAELLFL